MVGNERNGTTMALKPSLIIQARILSGLLGFVGLYFILNRYGRETYGGIAFTMSLLGVINAVSDLGFSQAHIRHLSRGEDEGRCNGTFLVIKLLLTAVMVVIVLVSLFVYTALLGRELRDTSPELILLFALYYVLLDLVSVATTTFSARRETAKGQLTLLMDSFVRVPLVILIALLGLNASFLYLSYVVGAASVMVVGFLLLSRHPMALPSRSLFRSYLTFALPLFIVYPAGAFANYIDKILLGIFWTTRDVGAYGAIEGLITTLSVLYIAVNTLSYPLFSKLESEGNKREMTQVMHKAERYLLTILLPAVALGLAFPREILGFVLGPQMEVHAPLFRIYLAAFAVYTTGMVYYPLILAAGRTDISRLLALLYATIFGVLCLLLIPQSLGGFPAAGMRAQGAAWALLVTNLFNTLGIRFYAWRVTGVPANPTILRHGVAMGATGLFLLVWSRTIGVSSLPVLLAVGILALLLQFGLLCLFRELRREDFKEMLDTLHPTTVGAYIAGELRSLR